MWPGLLKIFQNVLAAPQLETTDRCQYEPPRKQTQQERDRPDAEAGEHRALTGHETSITGTSDRRSRNLQKLGIKSRLETCSLLKFRRHRAGAQRRDPYAPRAKLVMQRLGERQHISLGGIIDRHARTGQKSGNRCDIEYASAKPDQALGKPQ